jgi:hypothetical protein
LARLALGVAAVEEARYDAACCFAEGVQANSRFGPLYFLQAMALALAGRVEEARPIVRQGSELAPGFRTMRFIVEIGVAQAPADKFAEGARLLALPE